MGSWFGGWNHPWCRQQRVPLLFVDEIGNTIVAGDGLGVIEDERVKREGEIKVGDHHGADDADQCLAAKRIGYPVMDPFQEQHRKQEQ